ncbi:hypothetical protein Sar04_07220 [Salinispora arenicola]|uniref:Uncharacterized protein n=1 Tax=Salinispora arenicola TaxID=168697 RepID=A0ABQ4JQ18_SALAC|nr:hypothetical protein Sar04_07220 [Salinispora arenicola]
MGGKARSVRLARPMPGSEQAEPHHEDPQPVVAPLPTALSRVTLSGRPPATRVTPRPAGKPRGPASEQAAQVAVTPVCTGRTDHRRRSYHPDQ